MTIPTDRALELAKTGGKVVAEESPDDKEDSAKKPRLDQGAT